MYFCWQSISQHLVHSLFMNQNQESTTTIDQYSSDEFLKERLQLSEDQFDKIIEMDNSVFRSYQALIDIECETNF